MKDLKNNIEFKKYFHIIEPSEIKISKEEIFYRDKYNDIINYIKAMLTNHEENVLNGYLSPKGAVLINLNPGTDLLDYIKLIANNYYLNLIEFNETEILDAPDKFLKSFSSLLEFFLQNHSKDEEDPDSERDPNKIDEKKLILINQQPIYKDKFDSLNLLEVLLNFYKTKRFEFNFIDSSVILVWLNYDIQDINRISSNLFDIFDLFIRIPHLSKIERETVLKDFLELNPKIVFDINDIVNYTENWEVIDIKKLLKVGIFKHYLNSDLNETSNEITDILLNLISSGEYIPNTSVNTPTEKPKTESNKENTQNQQITYPKENESLNQEKDLSPIINRIRESGISEFMLNQLYEDAASKNYTELTIIIDKLNKKEPLIDNDMNLIAKYPFILNDTPNKAQINLEKAKKRIDLIKQAFGK
ncbi:MAG: hypothetical protein ACFE9Z_16410 [Promethearchaeota archaeon]